MFRKDELIVDIVSIRIYYNYRDTKRNKSEVKDLERKWLIEKRGHLTQHEAAELIGISRGAYANIEVGNRNPSVKIAKKIATALDFNWTNFFNEEVVETKQKRSVV